MRKTSRARVYSRASASVGALIVWSLAPRSCFTALGGRAWGEDLARHVGKGPEQVPLLVCSGPDPRGMEIMVTRHRHKQSRDELLVRYERGVWTYFLAVLGFALLGIVVWIGLLVL